MPSSVGRIDHPERVAARLAYALGGGELPFPLEIRSEKTAGGTR